MLLFEVLRLERAVSGRHVELHSSRAVRKKLVSCIYVQVKCLVYMIKLGAGWGAFDAEGAAEDTGWCKERNLLTCGVTILRFGRERCSETHLLIFAAVLSAGLFVPSITATGACMSTVAAP